MALLKSVGLALVLLMGSGMVPDRSAIPGLQVVAQENNNGNMAQTSTAELIERCKTEVECLSQGGHRLLAGGWLPEAIVIFQKVLRLQKEVRDPAGEYATLSDIGEIYRRLRQYSKALETYQAALSVTGELKDRAREGATLISVGSVYRDSQQFRKALGFYQQALSIHKELRNYPQEAATLYEIGAIYSALRQFSMALETYQQALSIYKALSIPTESKENYEYIDTYDYKMKLIEIYNSVGEVYTEQAQYLKALEFFNIAQGLETGWTNRTNINFGRVYTHLGRYSDALQAFSQVTTGYPSSRSCQVAFRRRYRPFSIRPFTNHHIGTGTRNRQDATLVERPRGLRQQVHTAKHHRQVERLRVSKDEGLQCATELAIAFSGKAEVYLKLGKYNQSLDHYHYALKLFQGITPRGYVAALVDQAQQAVILNNMGVAYKNQGNYERALRSYQQALAIRQENKDKLGEANNLNNIGEIYRNRGEYNKAIESYQKSLEIFNFITCILDLSLLSACETRSDATLTESIVTNDLNVKPKIDRFRIIHLATHGSYSLTTLSESIDYRILGLRKNSITKISFNFENATDEVTLFQDIPLFQNILQSTESCIGRAAVLHNLGVVYDELGQLEKALEFYQQSLSIRRYIKDNVGEGATLNNIGLAYEGSQNYSKALEFYQQSLTIRRASKDRSGEASTLNNIGLIYGKLGKPAQSLEPLQQALLVFQELGDQAGEGNTLDSLGTIYKDLGQFDKAQANYQQALKILRTVGNRPIERITLRNIGDFFKQQQQSELAIVFYKQSINLTEQIRDELRALPLEQQKSYTATVAGTYRTLADLLMDRGRLAEAQRVLELLKIQELRNFTRSTENLDKQEIALLTLEKDILKQYETIINFGQKILDCEQKQQDCKQLRDRLDALTQAFNTQSTTFQKELRQRLAQDPAFLTSDQLSGVASDIINAQSGTALIYPLVLETKIRILIAVKAGEQGVVFRTIEIPNVGQKNLWETVNQFRDQLKTQYSDPKQLQTTSAQLYDWLIRPLAPELNTGKITNLVFSLDRATRYIPMAALYDNQKNQYLIQQYPVSTILSAELTKMDDRLPKDPNQTSVLGLGLSEAVPGFNALNAVPTELDTIVRQSNLRNDQGIYNGTELLNKSFSLTSFRDSIKQNKIIHIATHGSFEPGNPTNSFILSGNGEKLTIDQLRTLSNYMRNVHLVVLSACQTAVGGPDESGIEVPGISFYFLQNKAKSVLASLWLVNDPATSLLMQEFYKHLATGKYTKAEALQKAQVSLLNQQRTAKDLPRASAGPVGSNRSLSNNFAHPYYWAPFILIGNSL